MALAFVLVMGFTLLIPAMASAENSASRKLGRGVSNVSLGVLAIPGQIVQTSRERGPFVGATWGFVKGVGIMAATEIVGVYELLTCPFEAPPHYKPIMTPEFPWEHFSEQPSRSERAHASRRTTR